jgi:hypothetical protein
MVNYEILKKIILLKNGHLMRCLNLINLVKNYINNYKKEEIIEPFNIILASSDLYYRENYHSDIIAYILKYKLDYLYDFINFININKNDNQENIEKKYYFDYKIEREEGKIDILIKNEETKHCIIVENKINNAEDMNRQLPKYYIRQIDQGFTVDKILYLSLDGSKRPDKTTWLESDYDLNLDKIIIYAAASNNSEKDLIEAFIKNCYNADTYRAENALFEQYKDLLIFLRRHEMDSQLMEKFYQEMANADNYNSALSIRNMLNDFPSFRRDRIYNYFVNNHKPFMSIGKHSYNDTFFFTVPTLSKENMKIDIFAEEESTVIRFWIQEPKTKEDTIFEVLNIINENKSFRKEEINSYRAEFKYPDEEEKMYKYITKLFDLLENNSEIINGKKRNGT